LSRSPSYTSAPRIPIVASGIDEFVTALTTSLDAALGDARPLRGGDADVERRGDQRALWFVAG
jgi:hypothetical protein